MEFHAPSPKPLTSKVVGVDVDCSPAALHYTGNELFWMHGVIGAREDLPCAQWRCCNTYPGLLGRRRLGNSHRWQWK